MWRKIMAKKKQDNPPVTFEDGKPIIKRTAKITDTKKNVIETEQLTTVVNSATQDKSDGHVELASFSTRVIDKDGNEIIEKKISVLAEESKKEPCYVTFDPKLFKDAAGNIPNIPFGTLEIKRTDKDTTPAVFNFAGAKTEMTVKSKDGQEYTLIVGAGGAKLKFGDHVYTYNSVDENGKAIALDATLSTDCIERLCDVNDDFFGISQYEGGVTYIKKRGEQFLPYSLIYSYCMAKGIDSDPKETKITEIPGPSPSHPSFFAYTPPTGAPNASPNPLIFAKLPSGHIVFYSAGSYQSRHGNWHIITNYFFQQESDGKLSINFDVADRAKDETTLSYSYGLNIPIDANQANAHGDGSTVPALHELLRFIQSGKSPSNRDALITVKGYAGPGDQQELTLGSGGNEFTIKIPPRDNSGFPIISPKLKVSSVSDTQEKGSELPPPPPPPGPTRTPLKKVTEQKKYGPLPGHITTILAIGLMMCSVLLGPLAGAVLASIGALAFIGGQSYLMLLDYLNDPLHAIRTKYIDPLTEQEREFENEQIDFWENEQAINKNIEEAQGLVAAFDEMWGENKPPFYGQEFGYTQDNAKDFVVPPTWEDFISEENMQQRFDMIEAYQGLINKGDALEEKDINEFIRKHVYKGSDKEVVKKIQSQLFENVSKAKIQESEITSFQKDGKHILYGESLGITDKNKGEFNIPLTLDEFNADGNKDNREKFQTAYKELIKKGNTLEEKDINDFIRTHIYTGDDQTIVETIRSRFFDSSLRPKIPQAQISAFSKFNQDQKDNLAERQGLMDKQRKILVNGDKRIINATIFDKKLTPEQRLQRVQRYAKGIMERFITESDMGTEDFTAFLSSFPENERGLVAEILSKAQNEVEIEIELENKNFKNGKAERKQYVALTTIFSQLGKMEDDIRAVFRGLSSTISEDTLQRNKETLNVATAKSKLTQQKQLLGDIIENLPKFYLSLKIEEQSRFKNFVESLTTFEDDTKKEIANLMMEREELLAQTSFNSDMEIAREKYSTGKDWIEMPHAPSYAFDFVDLEYFPTSTQVDHFVRGRIVSYLKEIKHLSPEECENLLKDENSTDNIIKELGDAKLPKEIQLIKDLHEKNKEIQSKVDEKISEKQASLSTTITDKVKEVADKKITTIVEKYLKNKYKKEAIPEEVIEDEKNRLLEKVKPIAYGYLATCEDVDQKLTKSGNDFTISFRKGFTALCSICVDGNLDYIASTTLTMNATDMALDATNAKLRQMLTERFGAEKANLLMDGKKAEKPEEKAEKPEEKTETLEGTLNTIAKQVEDYNRGIADRKKKITSLVKSRLSEEQLAPFVDKFVEELGAKDLSSFDSVLDFALKKMEESSVNMDNGHGAYVNKTIKEHFIEELKQTDKNFAKKMKELEKQPDSDERKKEIDKAIKYAVTHPTMSRQARKLETRKAAYALKAEEKDLYKTINGLFSTLEDELSKVKGQPEAQIPVIKKWLEDNKDNLSGSNIFKDIGDKINEKDVAKIMSDVRKQLDEKRASLEKEVKKLHNKVKKSDKKVEKKKKKKQRKINKGKSKAARDALNAAKKQAAARESAAAATERERESGAEREAGAGRASESSEEMGS